METDVKAKKNKKKWLLIPLVLVAWAALGGLVTLVFGGGEKEPFTVEIFAPAVSVGPLSVSECTLWGFAVTGILAVLAILFRVFCVPRFQTVPHGVQNVMELAVEKLDEYITSSLGRRFGEPLSAYLLALCAYLIGCAVLELFGVRSPSSDILTTFSLALVTFYLINYYGLRKKGLRRRLQDFTKPTPIMAPIKMITDVAIPVSMACRLFGNMLAGLIIMELIYYALGNFAIGPPAVAGLYFNVFHPLIQAFIFLTLTLSFIAESTETE